MRSYKRILAISCLSAAFLVACGDDEEVTNAPENAPTEQENGTSTAAPTDAPFLFTKFSLDVDYGDNKEFEVDYDNESTGVEASYDHDINNEKINGDDAYTKIEPMFKQLTFDVNTPNEEVISEVKKVFNVGEDYKEFDLEVRFADGTEKKYHEMK